MQFDRAPRLIRQVAVLRRLLLQQEFFELVVGVQRRGAPFFEQHHLELEIIVQRQVAPHPQPPFEHARRVGFGDIGFLYVEGLD